MASADVMTPQRALSNFNKGMDSVELTLSTKFVPTKNQQIDLENDTDSPRPKPLPPPPPPPPSSSSTTQPSSATLSSQRRGSVGTGGGGGSSMIRNQESSNYDDSSLKSGGGSSSRSNNNPTSYVYDEPRSTDVPTNMSSRKRVYFDDSVVEQPSSQSTSFRRNNNVVEQQQQRPQQQSRRIDYRSPQESYEDALNFESKTRNSKTNTYGGARNEIEYDEDDNNGMQVKFERFVKSVNDSVIIYPAVVCIVSSLSVLLVLFQKKVSALVKIILVILYIGLLLFTFMTFKQRVNTTTTVS